MALYVGYAFRIKASVLNKSKETVYFSSICGSSLSANFSSNVSVEGGVACLAFGQV